MIDLKGDFVDPTKNLSYSMKLDNTQAVKKDTLSSNKDLKDLIKD